MATMPGRRSFASVTQGGNRHPAWGDGLSGKSPSGFPMGTAYTNNNMVTPPIGSPSQGCFPSIQMQNSALPMEQIIQLVTQTFQNTLQVIQQEHVREKREMLNRIEGLERQLHELRQVSSRSGGRDRGFPRSEGQKRRWQAPSLPTEPSPDTPNVNQYIKRCAELDEALKNGRSVAEEGDQCEIIEHVGDILDAVQPVKAQAVAADLKCSVGVAAAFTERVGRPKPAEGKQTAVGDIVVQEAEGLGIVLNVVVKEKSSHKYYKKPEPYLEGVHKAFRQFADHVKEQQYEEIALTYMCSGTERLHRLYTMDLLYQELKDCPVKIHYYNLHQSRRWNGAGQLFQPKQVEEAREKEVDNGEDSGGSGAKTTRKSARATNPPPRFRQ